MDKLLGLIVVMIVAFGLNIPLGMWRVRTKKFSLRWFISIHIVMPLIFILRVSQGLAYWAIPIFIAVAVLGQLVGGCLSNRQKVDRTKPVSIASK